ncbi:uncharacterized protein LOC122444326 [Cervus canadensis]|uniref:uncharacterized protein LOC122444326 n=1 Tax=Cervus canadensis TaxID=1574408 RepID=UPI001C9E6D25|nr:uncharacterized protein LOC122444326 [Cervus canadensis]
MTSLESLLQIIFQAGSCPQRRQRNRLPATRRSSVCDALASRSVWVQRERGVSPALVPAAEGCGWKPSAASFCFPTRVSRGSPPRRPKPSPGRQGPREQGEAAVDAPPLGPPVGRGPCASALGTRGPGARPRDSGDGLGPRLLRGRSRRLSGGRKRGALPRVRWSRLEEGSSGSPRSSQALLSVASEAPASRGPSAVWIRSKGARLSLPSAWARGAQQLALSVALAEASLVAQMGLGTWPEGFSSLLRGPAWLLLPLASASIATSTWTPTTLVPSGWAEQWPRQL